MPRFVHPQFSATWECDCCRTAPASLANIAAFNAFPFQLLNALLNVVAHEVDFVELFIGRMQGKFRSRKCKYEPSPTGVNGVKAEHIAKEYAIFFCVFRINERADASDHLYLGISRVRFKAPDFVTRILSSIRTPAFPIQGSIIFQSTTSLNFSRRFGSRSKTRLKYNPGSTVTM